MLEICKNQNLSVNIRADASDMLLSYGSSENKEEAKIILDSLSFDNHTIKTIYNNKENVHTSTINKTAINTITIIIEDVNKCFKEKIFGFLLKICILHIFNWKNTPLILQTRYIDHATKGISTVLCI